MSPEGCVSVSVVDLALGGSATKETSPSISLSHSILSIRDKGCIESFCLSSHHCLCRATVTGLNRLAVTPAYRPLSRLQYS